MKFSLVIASETRRRLQKSLDLLQISKPYEEPMTSLNVTSVNSDATETKYTSANGCIRLIAITVPRSCFDLVRWLCSKVAEGDDFLV